MDTGGFAVQNTQTGQLADSSLREEGRRLEWFQVEIDDCTAKYFPPCGQPLSRWKS